MAEGKNIEIKIAATGGDQAAGEIKKLEEAAKTTTTGFGGMLDNLPERVETVTEKVNELATATEDLNDGVDDLKKELGPVAREADAAGKALGDATKNADDLDGSVKKIKQVQMAQAFAEVSGKVAEFAEKVKDAGPELEATFGSENAALIRGFAEGINDLAGAATAAAVGFAAGGPLGGAIAGTAAMTGDAIKEFVSMRTALSNAEDAADRAAKMQQKLNDVLKNGVESQEGFAAAVLSDDIKDQYERQTEALKGLIDELDQARKLTSAEDKVASAKRDNEDAAAIRGGAAPEDVKAKRAADDAARAKARIDYDLENEKKLMLEKQKIAKDAEDGLAKQKADTGSTPEQIKAAEDVAKKARDASDQAERKLDNKRELAPLEKDAIDAKATGKVTGLEADKQKRVEKERDTAEKKAQTEAERAAREAATRERKTTTAQAKDDGEMGRTARTAEGMIPKGASDKFRKDFQKVSDGLQNGDQGGEVAKMLSMIESLATAVEKRGDKALARRLDILEQRIRGVGK